MSPSRFPFIAKVMLSIEGTVAFGSTRWLDSSRINFIARTFAIEGSRVRLRIIIPDTQEPVDAAVILEEVTPSEDWSAVTCTGVILKMNVQHRARLEECLERLRSAGK